ncbi:DNA polymerase III subunit gamma/tau [Salinimonas sp. HHU 13199]|uniref:DNA polymerase III subunit gamma/tau n=1 Tax=Salinimonas profundi TaxID=2729140 RepID=A0ABR8LQ01_9ALTE|nr:DNA polymerase III subunit gamma/tau [Salinimonas profundi]MBD3587443.1 DNA polymerase III subunit gamma/tau [Salinimonas profundi]
MSYQVLARKWRPGRFSELVGQEHVVSAIANALDNDRLHHAYLFTGTRGVGKTTIARIFSKSLNCEQGMGSEPCGQCETCIEIEQGRYVDLLEIDAASRTKVEDTRELLDNVQYKPTRGKFKVYLIDEVHMLSKHSFNALLKTLEEPPPHVKFLLATTDPQKLPVTILSRCLQFNLKALSREQISQQLAYVLDQESVPFETSALALLARAANGSMRDALSLTDQAIAQGDNQVVATIVTDMLGLMDKHQVLKLLLQVIKKSPRDVLQIVDDMAQQSPDYSQLLAELSSLLHQIALTQWVPDACKLETTSAKAIYQLAKQVSAEQVQLFYQIALEGRKDLPHAVDGRSAVEMTLLRMMSFAPAPGVKGPEDVIASQPVTGSVHEQLSEPASESTFDTSAEFTQSEDDTAASSHDRADFSDVQSESETSGRDQSVSEMRDAPSVTDAEFDAGLARQMDDIELQAQEYRAEEALYDNEPVSEQYIVQNADEQHSSSLDHHSDENEPSGLSATQEMLALRQRLKRQREEDAAQTKKPEPTQPFVPPRRESQGDPGAREIEKSNEADGVASNFSDSNDSSSASEQIESAQNDLQPPWSMDDGYSDIADESEVFIDGKEAFVSDQTIPEDAENPTSVNSMENVSSPSPELSDNNASIQPYLNDNIKLTDANQIDSWSNLISRMNVAGLIKQIVLHSSYEKKDSNIILELDASQAHLLNDNAIAQVKQALSTALNESIQLDIRVGEPAQTPFSLQQQINAMRQQYAHQVVGSDTLFTSLTDAFNASVKGDTVKAR